MTSFRLAVPAEATRWEVVSESRATLYAVPRYRSHTDEYKAPLMQDDLSRTLHAAPEEPMR